MEAAKVFVSSTRIDLVPYREAIRTKLVELGLIPLAMETFGAAPADPVTVSTDRVRECDVFVGIYAYRYGHTPTEGGPSITEQEYDAARASGKRCLCYVADAALRPAQSDEPEAKTTRLEAFKGRLDRELVRGHFAAPAELASHLGDDLYRLFSGGEPLGYAFDDLWARWMAFEGAERERIFRYELEDRPPVVPSPLTDEWAHFIDDPDWHEAIAGRLRDIHQATTLVPQLGGLGAALETIDVDADYETVRARLRGALRGRWQDQVRALIERLPEAAPPAERAADTRLAALIEARGALGHLQEEADDPAYGRLFLVAGSSGAGKTHFVAERLTEVGAPPSPRDRRYFVLPLERTPAPAPLEQRVLEGVRRASGLAWRTLEEFDRFLLRHAEQEDERRLVLVVAIDDVHKGLGGPEPPDESVDGFIRSALRLTHVHCLYWLVMLEQTSYPQVTRPGRAVFWNEYGWWPARESPSIGSWLALDAFNERTGLGLALIRDRLGSEHELALDHAAQAETTRRWLSQPFLAWVLVDLQAGGVAVESLIDLNYIGFVTRFWERRRDQLRGPSLSPEDLDVATALLAKVLDPGRLTPTLTDLLDRITTAAGGRSELQDRAKADAALRALERGNLLGIAGAPDPELADVAIDRVTLRFETFWAWRLARQLVAGDVFATGEPAEIVHALEAAAPGVASAELRQAWLVFALLLLAPGLKRRPGGDDLVEPLVAMALQSTQLPRSSVWLAGPKADLALQKSLGGVAQALQERGVAVAGDDVPTLFALMHFVRDVAQEVLAAPPRLGLLQPSYSAIAAAGLADYFLYVVDHVVAGAAATEDVRACMHRLAGCEPMEVTETLADTVVTALVRVAETRGDPADCPGRVLDSVVAYLRDVPPHWWQTTPGAAPVRRSNLWHWVIVETCRWLVSTLDLSAHDVLVRKGWYAGSTLGLPPRMAGSLRSEANLALGYWYRGHHRERAAYVQLVSRLAQSRARPERERAFFLVRHTSHVQGRGRPAVVEKAFAEVLRVLAADPSLARTMADYPTGVPGAPMSR